MQTRLLCFSCVLFTCAGIANIGVIAGRGPVTAAETRLNSPGFALPWTSGAEFRGFAKCHNAKFLPVHGAQTRSVAWKESTHLTIGPLLSQDKELSAERLNSEGRRSLQAGDVLAAQDYYSRAQVLQQQLGSQAGLAESLNGLGTVSVMRGNPVEAMRYFQEALEALERLGNRDPERAKGLLGMAYVAIVIGDHEKAESYLREALAIQEKVAPRAREMADILDRMGDVWLLRDNVVRALAFYRRALHLRQKAAPDSLDLAHSFGSLGVASYHQGRVAQAKKYQLRALALREKLAPESLALANSYVDLGICCENGSSKAQSWFEQALVIQRRLAPDSLHVARTLSMMAHIAASSGDLDQAESYQRESLAIVERLASGSTLFAFSLLQMGDIASNSGDLDRAAEYLERALLLDEKLAPGSSTLAFTLTTLGTLAYRRGDFIGAENYSRRSLSIPQPPVLAALTLRQLGQMAHDRGDFMAARRYHQRALSIQEKTVPGSPEVADSLYDLGSVSLGNGDLATAERYYRRALALWSRTVPGSLSVAQGLRGLGTLSAARRDWRESQRWLQQALLICRRKAPGGFDMSQTLSALGDAVREQGELDAAAAFYRESLSITAKIAPASANHAQTTASLASLLSNSQPGEAEQLYENASLSIETQMARFGGSEEVRYGFRARYESSYKDYVNLLAAKHKPEEAFAVSERLRARTLLEDLAAAGVDIRQGADPALVRQQRSLQGSIKAKIERRMQLLAGNHSQQQLDALDSEITTLFRQKEDVAAQIRSASPVYAALTQPQTLSAKDVQQKLLDADTVLLEYSLGKKRSYVFVVSRESVAAYELPQKAEIEAAARQVYAILTARTRMRPGEIETTRMVRLKKTEAQYPQASGVLSEMVLGPVARHLTGKRILIVSDGILQYVPFSALPAPEHSSEYVPLIAEHEVISLPSASVLQVLRQVSDSRAPQPYKIAVLADPVFTASDDRVNPAMKEAGVRGRLRGNVERASRSSRELLLRSAADVGIGTASNLFPRLFFTREEAKSIVQQSAGTKSKLALNFEASRATALSRELSEYSVLHFATHGLLNSEHPELSGMVLSLVDKRGRSQNGFLSLEDIYNLNLHADMVVLSGCETGLGKDVQGEGLVGLTRGFMHAGASRVVASLWNVDDAATAEVMAKFYRGILKEGLQPGAALRKAQTEMWMEKRWRFPYYWASFVMQGEW